MPENALDQELTHLVQVSWFILMPVGLLLAMVLYKLFTLLHGVSEFLTIARHELSPALQDLRKTATHVEILSAKAVEGVATIEKGAQATGPAVKQGLTRLKAFGDACKYNALAVAGGILQSFTKKKGY